MKKIISESLDTPPDEIFRTPPSNPSDNEDSAKKGRRTEQVPPYRENTYIESASSPDIFAHTDWLIEQVDQINEYAEIYFTYPTQENKKNATDHIAAFARACSHYAYLFKFNQERFEERNRNPRFPNELRNIFSSETLESLMRKFQNLDRIAQSCQELVSFFFYVEESNNPPYEPAPAPLEGFPLSPIEGYKTNLPSEEIVKIFILFIRSALGPANVGPYFSVTSNREAILKAFETIRSHNENNIFDFNLDPVELKDELKKYISNEEGDVMYIIHAFQIFIVYGNFIVEGSPPFVTGLNTDQMINQSELASTVYLYLSMHGNFDIRPGKYRKNTPYTNSFKISQEVQRSILPTFPGMRLFMQKQAEPFAFTFTPSSLKSYTRGTLSQECGLCRLECKQKFSGDCDCESRLSDKNVVSTLSTSLNKQLRLNKIPTVSYIQKIYNEKKQDILTDPNYSPYDPSLKEENFRYTPGNITIPDPLARRGSTSPRNREFIGRIPLYTTKYIKKSYEADLSDGYYGIYNLLTGNLFTATKIDPSNAWDNGFTTQHMGTGRPRFYTSGLGLYETILKIRKNSDDRAEVIPNAPYYLSETNLVVILGYFHDLGYRNIFFVDDSCEVDETHFPKTGSKFTLSQRLDRSDYVGNSGLGLTKKPRKLRRHKRKTRKHKVAKRSPRRTLKKN
jgi:hypothetical protein